MNDSLYVKLKAQLQDLESPIDFHTLHNYLTDLQGSEYDIILLSQLFAKLNKDTDSLVTVEEFIETLTDSEQMIRQRLHELIAEIEDCSVQLSANTKLAEHARRTEKYNALGLSEDSELTAILESVELQRPGGSVFVNIDCDQQFRRSKTKNGRLEYNETFKLSILQGVGDVKFSVFKEPDQLIGECSVPFEVLKHQEQIDESFDLVTTAQTQAGIIKLKLLWVWNYTLYYEGLAAYWDDQLEQSTTDSQLLSSQLMKLMLPFQNTLVSMSSEDHSKTSNSQQLDVAVHTLELGDLSDNSKPVTPKAAASLHSSQQGADNSFQRAEFSGNLSFDSAERKSVHGEEDLSFSDFKAYIQHENPSNPQQAKNPPPIGVRRARIESVHEKTPKGADTKPIGAIRQQEVVVKMKQKPTWTEQQSKAESDPRNAVEIKESTLFPNYQVSSTSTLTGEPSLPLGLLLFLLAMVLLSAFSRPDFLNVSCSQLTLIALFLAKTEIKLSASVLIASLVLSQIVDLIWLGFFSSEGNNLDHRVRVFVYWTVMAGFVGKCVLLKVVSG